jgi:uncharacterized pyridoxal phosphate-containing UPF0001 family protein
MAAPTSPVWPRRGRWSWRLAVAKLPRLQLRGVMSIPDRPDFAAQLALHQGARKAVRPESVASRRMPGAQRFDTLSMGMTADLDAAIQAGSTMVRVGTGIFGARTYPAA